MIAIGNDHGGFSLAEIIIAKFQKDGIAYKHFGAYSAESCDYPDFAKPVCEAVISGECEKGILVCGTGIGMSMAANKINGIRAALCSEEYSAEMTRRHNDANILCLGARVTGDELALSIIKKFLSTEFEGGRHARRVEKVMNLESK